MKIIINREEQDEKQTLGTLFVFHQGVCIFGCKTLELPWRNNERRVSRIPQGFYVATFHHSSKFGHCLWVKDVDGRSEILIHKGNYHRDTLGCILVGSSFADIDSDGHKDVLHSSRTMEQMLRAMREHIEDGEKITVNIWDEKEGSDIGG